jgi:predicted lactoylglutathione lyase
MSTAPTPDAPAAPAAPVITNAAPVITNAGSAPATRHQLFVNLPVADLQRSITFFEALGFRFNPRCTDATATCLLVGEDAYVMLLTHARFRGFSGRPMGDRARETNALFALSGASRGAVDALVRRAVAAGGAPAAAPQDHGFMYGSSFRDPDGHHWEVFWMDPAAIPG